MPIKAVLFDHDGVLVDSPPVHVRSWIEVFRPFGVELPPRRIHMAEGRKAEAIARGIVEEYGLKMKDDEIAALIERKRAIYRASAPTAMRKDSRLAIEALRKAGVKVAVVSGAALAMVMSVLPPDEVALLDAFVTAEDYKNSKPDPEPFLTGCSKLGATPAQSVAVENAPLGVTAAKAAGIFTIGVTTTVSAEDLAHADLILVDMNGLAERILSI